MVHSHTQQIMTVKEKASVKGGKGRGKDDIVAMPDIGKRLLIPESATKRFHGTMAARETDFRKALQAWVLSHEGHENKQKAELLSKRISYIVHDTFMYKLKDSLKWLSSQIKGQTYHMLLHVKYDEHPIFRRENQEEHHISLFRPKSSAWLGHYVEKALAKSVLYGFIVFDDTKSKVVTDITIHADVPWSGRNIVLVDDASYSGQQMASALESLHEYISREFSRNVRKWTPVTVWVVVPFRTPDADLLLQNAVKKYSSSPEMRISVNPDYTEMESTNSIFKNLNIDAPVHKGRRQGAALTVFSHKVPDGLSFPESLARGVKIRGGRLDNADAYDAVPFLPADDPKPYSSSKVIGVAKHIRGGYLNDSSVKYNDTNVLRAATR